MTKRKEPLVTGEIYHIYNRGAGKQDIYEDDLDSWRFIQSMIAFNTSEAVEFYSDFPNKGLGVNLEQLEQGKSYVEILAYALNPNHFHMVVRQLQDGGISEYMRKLSGGFTSHMNRKYEHHSGALFQGTFKSRLISNNEQLQYILAYVHGNDLIHDLDMTLDKRIRNSRWELSDQPGFHMTNNNFLYNVFTTKESIVLYIKETARNINLQRQQAKLNLE